MAPDLLTAPVSSVDSLTSSLSESVEPLTSADPGLAETEPDTFTVTMRPDAPDWFWEAVDEIVSLLTLPVGWDSHGSPAISKAIAVSSIQLLGKVARTTIQKPDVIPTSTGGVAFEWSTPDHTLEVEVIAPGRGELYYENLRTGAEDEVSFTEALALEDFLGLVST